MSLQPGIICTRHTGNNCRIYHPLTGLDISRADFRVGRRMIPLSINQPHRVEDLLSSVGIHCNFKSCDGTQIAIDKLHKSA
ncbi:MAG: hypothetical protein ACD_61C00032G0001 [uncultured bacterium]|nr:MAG: hypothetical protein ACD_61C00032G0001 [uncultured bacterium]